MTQFHNNILHFDKLYSSIYYLQFKINFFQCSIYKIIFQTMIIIHPWT